MGRIFRFAPLIATLFVGACGTYTPELQENPADRVGGEQLVQSIVYNVNCEVRDAINWEYVNPDQKRPSTFLDTWGVQIALNLQVEEKSSINPVGNWIPPSPATAVFNFLFGGTVSADATRQDKLNSYYTVQQIRQLGPCDPKTRPGGLLLMQSDLGLKEWVDDNVIAGETGKMEFATDYSDGPLKTNVISHEIKFDITDTGNLTAGWKLRRVSLNQTGNLFSASRDRTNDLTVTLGPTVPTSQPKVNASGQPIKDRTTGKVVMTTSYVPSDQAYNAALSSQIGLAVSNALRATTLP